MQKADTNHWRQLFNGKDLTGWKHVGPGSQYVEDGLIKSHGGMGLLYWTGEKFGNCTIRIVFRMRETNSNSGVFIRIPIEPYEEWMPVFYGYEVQIDNKPELSNEDDYQYNCLLDEKIYSARAPRAPLLNSNYDGSFIAGMLQLRYIYSMPIERIVKYFAEHGFEINKSTVHGLIKKSAWMMERSG